MNIINKTFISPEQLAEQLKMNPEYIRLFEDKYRQLAIDKKTDENNLFEYNSRDISQMIRQSDSNTGFDTEQESVDIIKHNIVYNLLHSLEKIEVKNGELVIQKKLLQPSEDMLVTAEQINLLPHQVRPLFTSTLMKVDVSSPSSLSLISMWLDYINEKNIQKKKLLYHMFRQGLDILDLDPITYEILSHNPNSMSYWLPYLAIANKQLSFFKIPDTTIVKVPMPILQLTRIDYTEINRTTMDMVNDWTIKAFGLNPEKEYFIKTGTYSSKYDFRNTKVTGAKEVNELGEYLLFIHHQALQMASPLSSPCIYGASTTNEWVVRDFIKDTENNPTIYKGLPLHTEYRVFVDCDKKEIMGYTPYWKKDVMKKRFKEGADRSVHDLHDYIIYEAYSETLEKRYMDNIDQVIKEVKKLVQNLLLTGQWSIDIMQNGSDFWIIDMATADTSALRECVHQKIKDYPVEWIKNNDYKLFAEK